MTHAERNAAISKKIAAYTEKFTASKDVAKAALQREGLGVRAKAKKARAAA